jgi:hypothetical protein
MTGGKEVRTDMMVWHLRPGGRGIGVDWGSGWAGGVAMELRREGGVLVGWAKNTSDVIGSGGQPVTAQLKRVPCDWPSTK